MKTLKTATEILAETHAAVDDALELFAQRAPVRGEWVFEGDVDYDDVSNLTVTLRFRRKPDA